MMRKWCVAGVSLLAVAFAGGAGAADLPSKNLPLKAPPAPAWSWTGLYVGVHVGGALGSADFSDPFGSPIFGDKIRTPGFLGGGQVGYNWQAGGSPWVFGVEADLSGLSSDGTNTCFAVSLAAVDATCRVGPQVAGTFTGHVGYLVGSSHRTLVYLKGGIGWANDRVDMALNNGGLATTSLSQTVTLWGGTVGAGVERALTPAWSVKLEYDYLGLGGRSIANLGSIDVAPDGTVVGTTAPGTAGLRQDLQEVKLGLNYKWGADPAAPGWDGVSPLAGIFTGRPLSPQNGWEIEGGTRYFGSWGQYKKDIGFFTTSGLPSISSISRLTYNDMATNSGEVFGRLETPLNLFVKGFIGAGHTGNGHMNDEDYMLGTASGKPEAVAPSLADSYSNTLASALTGNIGYGAIDGGFDLLRANGYKVGVFAGYFELNQDMSAFGCASLVNNACVPSVPTSGAPNITETDRWRALRLGVAAESMVTDRIKIAADVAYLPYVSFHGVDQHLFGNIGELASNNPETGTGQGVQLEALASYYVTPQWSVGLGGRYWGLWTTSGQVIRDFEDGEKTPIPPNPPSPPQYFKAQVEQAGVFVQTSYKFSIN